MHDVFGRGGDYIIARGRQRVKPASVHKDRCLIGPRLCGHATRNLFFLSCSICRHLEGTPTRLVPDFVENTLFYIKGDNTRARQTSVRSAKNCFHKNKIQDWRQSASRLAILYGRRARRPSRAQSSRNFCFVWNTRSTCAVYITRRDS